MRACALARTRRTTRRAQVLEDSYTGDAVRCDWRLALLASAVCRALAHVYMRNVAYAHSTSLTRSQSDTLVHTCAHAHAHSQADRFTHTDGIAQEKHTQTHACTHMHTRTYAQLPTYTHTHMNSS